MAIRLGNNKFNEGEKPILSEDINDTLAYIDETLKNKVAASDLRLTVLEVDSAFADIDDDFSDIFSDSNGLLNTVNPIETTSEYDSTNDLYTNNNSNTKLSLTFDKEKPKSVNLQLFSGEGFTQDNIGDCSYYLKHIIPRYYLNYDNVSHNVSSEDSYPRGITFNDDGSKLYMVGMDARSIHQYSLSTPYDLDTISYDNVSHNVSSEDDSPQGIIFNDEGDKLYMVGWDTDSIYQYSLSTPYDLDTISYDNVSHNVSSEDSSPRGIIFNNDGSRIYVVGGDAQSIHQYSLSTPYDLDTISYDKVSHDVSSEDGSPRGITINDEGDKLYIDGWYTESIHQYSLNPKVTYLTDELTPGVTYIFDTPLPFLLPNTLEINQKGTELSEISKFVLVQTNEDRE